jgi:hypothetical protein
MRLLSALFLASFGAACLNAEVTLVEDGSSRCVILVAPEIMEANRTVKGTDFAPAEAERQRQRLRESVKDLAHYLGKMSGAAVAVETSDLKTGDPRVPIYIGSRAEKRFGPTRKRYPFKQGFRVVVGPAGVGLFGESDLAASYAIFEVLDRLGCRWYMPSDLGEVIPERKSIRLPYGDTSATPGTIYRGVWYADDAYKRRNRLGGFLLQAGHALEMYITKDERKQHPEWQAEIGGKPSPHRLKWSSPTLADAIADKLIERHKKSPQPSYSLSPDDGADWDESKEDRAIDAGDFDTTTQKVAITDRLLVLCNRIATKVTDHDKDILFGVLAYVDYTRPPLREKVHPKIVPQIAPITYARAHPISDDRVPGNKDLRYIIEGWGKKAKMTSMYFYGWFLAEPSAPNPMLTKWAHDVPFVFKHNCLFWQPETISNFETSMHALYLGCRLAWNPALEPARVFDEINTQFYGHAAKEMTAYWQHIDRCWVDTPEYSGCGFAYLRRWTPERMAKARALLDAARAACKSEVEKRRVQLAHDSLALFELFMKLRRDQAEGRWTKLAEDANAWRKRVVELGEQYKDQYCFTRVGWTKNTVNGSYFGAFYQKTYIDAARVANDPTLVVLPPVRSFRYRPDPDKKGETLGWSAEKFDDSKWDVTDVCTQTWSTLGHHDYFKSMWYRTDLDLPKTAAGKKHTLWIGSTDGSVKVFINGKHVPYTDAKGYLKNEATGYCQPFSFDVTAAVRPGKRNSVALLCTRTFFNELGTGGLLAPIAFHIGR